MESYAKGPTSTPLLTDTIGAALTQAAARWGERLALVSMHQGIRMTWAELEVEAQRVASGLLDLGVAKGDRVGIWAPNCAEWAVIQFATAKIGAILVNINPAYRISEVEYALNKVGCSALVTAARFKTSDYIAMLRELGPERLPHLKLLVALGEERHEGFRAWDDLRAQADPVGSVANMGHGRAASPSWGIRQHWRNAY